LVRFLGIVRSPDTAVKFLEGQLLVSAPGLRDPNFFHSVLLLVKHNEEGAFGLVLNRASATQVVDVWGQISTEPCASRQAIRVGGPIEGPLMALHGNDALGDAEVLPGVYFAAEREKLEVLVAGPDSSARFFVGYSGWAPGQLESEMEEGAWATIEGSPARVFHDPDGFWEAMHKAIDGARLLSSLGIKHVPSDPRLN
jgi:putative transcriptional regulator